MLEVCPSRQRRRMLQRWHSGRMEVSALKSSHAKLEEMFQRKQDTRTQLLSSSTTSTFHPSSKTLSSHENQQTGRTYTSSSDENRLKEILWIEENWKRLQDLQEDLEKKCNVTVAMHIQQEVESRLSGLDEGVSVLQDSVSHTSARVAVADGLLSALSQEEQETKQALQKANTKLAAVHNELGRLVSESACERKDPGSNPAVDMVDAARNTAWDLAVNMCARSTDRMDRAAVNMCARSTDRMDPAAVNMCSRSTARMDRAAVNMCARSTDRMDPAAVNMCSRSTARMDRAAVNMCARSTARMDRAAVNMCARSTDRMDRAAVDMCARSTARMDRTAVNI
ncbi:hypothetical protein FHG87_019357 [Trinorchestia longiramus]|nr:hypothetical protein FHG87_019357 [Trinorchestia longiramus]